MSWERDTHKNTHTLLHVHSENTHKCCRSNSWLSPASPNPRDLLSETPETSAYLLMLPHPFPIHPLLCSVPPPPLPFPPQRVLSSDRTVNHTLSAGLILCVCVCPDVHLHFQQDGGSVFLTSIFHSFLSTLFDSSLPALHLSNITCVSIKNTSTSTK